MQLTRGRVRLLQHIGRAGSTRAKAKAWMHLWHAQVLAERIAEHSRRVKKWQVLLLVPWQLLLLFYCCHWLCDALVRHIHRTAACPSRHIRGILYGCCAPKCGSGTYFVWYLGPAPSCSLRFCVANDPFSILLSG